MATHERILTCPPSDKRNRELWIQHASGLIIFEDVRNYAIERLSDRLSEEARVAALKAIDDAVYGLMMIIDGVSGSLENDTHRIHLGVSALLTDRNNDETIAEINLADGEGMCMGFHGWKEGNFGTMPPMEQ
jgi:hypothetical protein